MTPEKLAEVEAILKADIRWTIMEGPGWDPDSGARFDRKSGVWITAQKSCGVCAVGAHVVRNNLAVLDVDLDLGVNDVCIAARSLGVDEDWLEDLYHEVARIESGNGHESAAEMAERLLEYADHVQAEKAARE